MTVLDTVLVCVCDASPEALPVLSPRDSDGDSDGDVVAVMWSDKDVLLVDDDVMLPVDKVWESESQVSVAVDWLVEVDFSTDAVDVSVGKDLDLDAVPSRVVEIDSDRSVGVRLRVPDAPSGESEGDSVVVRVVLNVAVGVPDIVPVGPSMLEVEEGRVGLRDLLAV